MLLILLLLLLRLLMMIRGRSGSRRCYNCCCSCCSFKKSSKTRDTYGIWIYLQCSSAFPETPDIATRACADKDLNNLQDRVVIEAFVPTDEDQRSDAVVGDDVYIRAVLQQYLSKYAASSTNRRKGVYSVAHFYFNNQDFSTFVCADAAIWTLVLSPHA